MEQYIKKGVCKVNKLKIELDKRGIKYKWLAEQSGLSVSTVQKYASGQRNLTLESAKKIAKALKMNFKDLL
jgi:putative transcriptional regulator